LELYRTYRFHEPWNSPHNSRLAEKMPAVYRCPTLGKANFTGTNYVVVVGDRAAFVGSRPVRFSEFEDGLASTFMLVESSSPVNWMSPEDLRFDDLSFDIEPNRPHQIGGPHAGKPLVAHVDGAIRLLYPDEIGASAVRNMFTRIKRPAEGNAESENSMRRGSESGRSSPAKLSSGPPLAVAPFDATQAREHQRAWAVHLKQPVELTNSIGMKLVLIPPGEFLMGSPESEADRDSRDEGPQHRVRITRPFWLGVHEVTQGEYQRVMENNNPSWFSRSGGGKDRISGDTRRLPVENVSWHEAEEFCRRLSELGDEKAAGRRYRLPTEAEWEYACRAGTTGDYGGTGNLGEMGWYDGNSGGRTHPVAQKRANGWGLYDMHGNVWEWVQDWWYRVYTTDGVTDPMGPETGSYRVLRGGSWGTYAKHARSAYRYYGYPGLRNSNIGFRLARTP
jgi:formylglycine-generating enzyme required for sulfatase activity